MEITYRSLLPHPLRAQWWLVSHGDTGEDADLVTDQQVVWPRCGSQRHRALHSSFQSRGPRQQGLPPPSLLNSGEVLPQPPVSCRELASSSPTWMWCFLPLLPCRSPVPRLLWTRGPAGPWLHLPCSFFLFSFWFTEISLKCSYIILFCFGSSILFVISICLDWDRESLRHTCLVPAWPEIFKKFLKLHLR